MHWGRETRYTGPKFESDQTKGFDTRSQNPFDSFNPESYPYPYLYLYLLLFGPGDGLGEG